MYEALWCKSVFPVYAADRCVVNTYGGNTDRSEPAVYCLEYVYAAVCHHCPAAPGEDEKNREWRGIGYRMDREQGLNVKTGWGFWEFDLINKRR